MVKNSDFTTEYYFKINYYDNETDYISFSLEENTAILNVTVENYQKDNQTITIDREYENKTQQIIVTEIIVMIAVACLIGAIIVVVFMVLSGVIYFIMFVIEIFISKVKKE